jgi:CBS domain-containing protein
MPVERFCRKSVVTTPVDGDVAEVAHRMRDLHVGAVVVVDERQRPVGMITDRDLVCRVFAEGRDPASMRAREVMTTELEVLHAKDSIDVALFRMRERGFRRLPIVDASGALCRMVSLDDLLVLLSAELGQAAGAVQENAGP